MKIQRFEGVEGYGDRTLQLGGYSQKKQAYRNIKLLLISLFTLCLLAAMQTTVLSKIFLPFIPSGRPSLCLLFTLAAGYRFGEREGGTCGLMAGMITECVNMEPLFGGIMILPLIYCLFGYISGALSQRLLAGNLPSFMIYAMVGAFLEEGCRLILTMITIKSFPPINYFLGGLLPAWIVTVLFSPLIYLMVKWGQALFENNRSNHTY